MNYIIEENFTSPAPSACASRFIKNVAVDSSFVKLNIWDTAGERQYWMAAPLYYNVADVALIMYNISNKESFNVAKRWFDEINSNGPKWISCALVGCKSDLASQREVLEEDLHAYAIENEIAVSCEISCKTGKNIDNLFANICRYSLHQNETRTAE
uniref:Uncharacterized protein n=2 Tax=Vannella robusta TaxID=1487602 RepID=A0A7S4HUJ2_9EUKA|mmetsp:Transcript_15921/g.20279  ORF Transcript_15921/g.20279 Transcript_15921/m.20279 type:complete len:156 (+) Transcript_15921:199-666(+)